MTADTLSCSPLTNNTRQTDMSLMEDTNIYVSSVTEGLPVSDNYMTELREQLCADSVCAKVMKYCLEGWPDQSQLPAPLRNY